jgi:hypothetical protein
MPVSSINKRATEGQGEEKVALTLLWLLVNNTIPGNCAIAIA